VKIGGEVEGLKPGMTAEIEVLVADLPDVLTVPVTCVVEQGGKHYSWAVVGDKYERRPVILGMTNDKLIEIKDGLKEGDVVLINPRAIVEEARKEGPKITPEAVDPKTKFGGAALKTETNGLKNGTNGEKKVAKDDTSAGGEASGNWGAGGQPKSAGSFKPPTVADIMKQDKDGDGKISKDEASDRQKERWDQIDTDGDGFISDTEAKAMVNRFNERMRQFQQQGGGGPSTTPGGGQ
jgi:HlyD family secretion protein